MSRRRARENPGPELLLPLIIAGGILAIGGGAYIATRPKAPTGPMQRPAPPTSSGGPSVPLQPGQDYLISNSDASGLPGSAQDFANQVCDAPTGWANVVVYYYGPTQQGTIPAEASVLPSGYVVRAMWIDPATTSDQAGIALGVPPGAMITPAGAPSKGANGRNLSAVAIVGGKPSRPGGVAQQTSSGGGGGGGGGGISIDTSPVNGAINSAQNALNSAQNAVNSAQNTAQNLQDQANALANTQVSASGGVQVGTGGGLIV